MHMARRGRLFVRLGGCDLAFAIRRRSAMPQASGKAEADMNSRERQDLDNYITGHWGEDQFRYDCDCDYPEEPADEQQFTCYDCGTIWSYDAGDDEWLSIGEVEESEEA
jgi:hypothetical protein